MSGNFTDAELDSALEGCSEEPIHIPGIIQSFACLLAISSDSGVIDHASENVTEFTGRPVYEVLGHDAGDVLGRELWHAIRNTVAGLLPETSAGSIGDYAIGDVDRTISVSVNQGHILVELEAVSYAGFEGENALKTLNFLMRDIQDCDNQQQLLDRTVQLMRHVSGYDRVLIYQFDPEYNGEVLAEDIGGSGESVLGLRFPHWDIPAQARAIMKRIPLRLITDIEDIPVALKPHKPGGNPLDVSLAVSRGVSKVHLEYLRNLGVASSMSLTILIEEELWGVISFHGSKPKTPAPKLRELLVTFSDVFAAKRQELVQRDRIALVERVDALKDVLIDEMSIEPDFEQVAPTLLSLLNAQGIVLGTDTTSASFGAIPDQVVVDKLLASARSENGRVLAYENLRAAFPDLSNEMSGCAGALALAGESGRALLVFREEIIREVTWAGNPEKEVDVSSEKLRLSPRKSFATYIEQMRDCAKPWSDQDRYFVNQIWTLINVVERLALMNALHLQQTIMTNELNHRVRNILALVRSISQQPRNDGASLETYTQSLESRIQAIATAHDIASGSLVTSVSIRVLIEREIEPFLADNKDVRIIQTSPEVHLPANKAPVFSLVVHELVTNAAKHGALSSESGRVKITLSGGPGGALNFLWQEEGGPPVIAPREGGFGSTLVERAVPYELNGTSALSYLRDGVQARIVLPAESLVTEFTGESPQQPAPEASSVNCKEASAVPEGAILVVEDNFVLAIALEKQLKKLGFRQTEIAGNAAKAFAFLETNQPVIALLDFNLGDGTTSEPIAHLLLEMGVPFAFTTGYGTPTDLGPELEGIPCLAKPFSFQNLQKLTLDLLGVGGRSSRSGA